jgi:hypothetical protein
MPARIRKKQVGDCMVFPQQRQRQEQKGLVAWIRYYLLRWMKPKNTVPTVTDHLYLEQTTPAPVEVLPPPSGAPRRLRMEEVLQRVVRICNLCIPSVNHQFSLREHTFSLERGVALLHNTQRRVIFKLVRPEFNQAQSPPFDFLVRSPICDDLFETLRKRLASQLPM